ncbi:MAG: hypothetical protein KMY50_01025, partial [Candidatus Desulforudis sp.]|nr:hypothetical protein [Desulforudis sp.]
MTCCIRHNDYCPPLTGFYAESTSGGRVAFPMRRTGYDAMVIEGASETSVFLEIS